MVENTKDTATLGQATYENPRNVKMLFKGGMGYELKGGMDISMR